MYAQRARARAARSTSPTASTTSRPARCSASTCSAPATDHLLELTHVERERIFNLGYFTWVEQQGVVARRLRGPPRASRSGRTCGQAAGVGRADRRVQRHAPGVAGRAMTPTRHRALVCAGCGAAPDPGEPFPFRCPNAGRRRRRPRARPRARPDPRASSRAGDDEPNPFVRYRPLLHAYHVAAAGGMERRGRSCALVRALDARGRRGRRPRLRGHAVRPQRRAERPLGFSRGRRRVGQGRDRQRLRLAQGPPPDGRARVPRGRRAARPRRRRPSARLAIASCGNAALAAAVVAAAAERDARVFIPADADPLVLARLGDLGARLTVCQREPGVAGDPTYFACSRRSPRARCRSAARATSTAWRSKAARRSAGRWPRSRRRRRLDRASSRSAAARSRAPCSRRLRRGARARRLSSTPALPRRPDRRRPPARTRIRRVDARVAAGADAGRRARLRRAATAPSSCGPGRQEPHSVAHGILDDETYDWLAVVRGDARRRAAAPLVVDEDTLERPTTSPARPPASTSITPARPGSPACSTSCAKGLVAPRRDRSPVLFTGARRPSRPRTAGTHPRRRTIMRSFLGRDILSLKDFERDEFFRVFQVCRRAGADRPQPAQQRPAEGQDAADRVLPAQHAHAPRHRGRHAPPGRPRARLLRRQDDPRRRLLPGVHQGHRPHAGVLRRRDRHAPLPAGRAGRGGASGRRCRSSTAATAGASTRRRS